MIAIDLGSNTIRFIEFDGQLWGRSFEKIVKTAESLHDTKQIGEKALGRIISAINEAKTKLDFASNDVRGYATAAMRMATNSDSIIEAIAAETGVRFTIIDAEKEANLSLNAVRYRLKKLDIEPSSFVMADIGGGSTELIVSEGETSRSISLNIGIVTLSERSNTPQKLSDSIESFKEQICSQSFPHTSLVLTAGTPTTIAAYLNGMDYETYDPEKVNGFRLHLEDCYRVRNELLNMDETMRARYVGVGRESLIIAGIMMVTAIYEALGYEEAIIIDDGLREGIALEYFR
ncbi:MAG: phosphatase [Sulfuricurvum sp.]|uniref:Ppx/GppA phosphatase family protein n=1 Tax=Sulfuricurvum sp. TaxID=2025608 RepID=UPI002606E9B1|nr:phosphatase [Sulfuricurvum sp.]MDD2368633.1 phosphatase [Sulfuricurvum sp.]MDD2950341.1 phosphatase [Sulfuricurvum sp.]MDD5117626.1 phosphatase [Sulfuricurvum sp.]